MPSSGLERYKFRVWDKEGQQIESWDTLVENEVDLLDLMTSTHYPPVTMQYTLFHDKTGKEIYEGDILDNFKFGREPKYVVEIPQLYFDMAEGDDGIEFTEVIGNIWENPELLDARK